MKSLLCPTLLSLLLFPTLASADEPRETPEEAPSAPEAAPSPSTIILTGEDEALTAAVAAELRAAGFVVDVVPPGGSLDITEGETPTIVAVRQEGKLVVVQATMVDDVVDAEVTPKGDDGMSSRDVAALRAAETIRWLVTARAAKTDTRVDEAEPAPTTPTPKTTKPVQQTAIQVPSVAVSMDNDLGPDALASTVELPRLRIGAHGGVAAIGYRTRWGDLRVTPGWVAGLDGVADLSRSAALRAQVSFMQGFDDSAEYDESDVWAVRARLVAEWEPLGADSKWTPILGMGIFGEIMHTQTGYGYATAGGYDGGVDEPWLDEDPLLGTWLQEEWWMLNSGLTANAGITAGRTWRFRFDVRGSLQVLSLGGPETFSLVPSALATAGFEWDVVTHRAPTPTVAQR